MDASGDRTHAVDRVAEIRTEIEAARARIAGTLEALRFKVDLPARLGDSVGNAAFTFTSHVIDRVVTLAEHDETNSEDATTMPMRTETDAVPGLDEGADSEGRRLANPRSGLPTRRPVNRRQTRVATNCEENMTPTNMTT